MATSTTEAHHELVARAIAWLDDHAVEQPRLEDVAAHVGMSPGHLQRVFTSWTGVSPKQFVQVLTAGEAGRLLAQDVPVLDAALGSGLSSAGRLHDLMVSVHAVTPGQARRRGEGLVVRTGTHPTPLGEVLVGVTERGVCHLAFVDDPAEAVRDLQDRWPGAELVEDPAATGPVVTQVLGRASGDAPLPVLLSGTNLQVQVWQALLDLPEATTTSYGALARAVGRPEAVRAVASAVGANRIAVLVPCHRVLRSTGALSGYRWGTDRKRRLLALEQARQSA